MKCEKNGWTEKVRGEKVRFTFPEKGLHQSLPRKKADPDQGKSPIYLLHTVIRGTVLVQPGLAFFYLIK